MNNSYELAVLDALQAMICILDLDGNIVYTNKAWREFSGHENSLIGSNLKTGNYFELCKSAVDSGDDYALKIILGIRKVLEEEESRVYLTYPIEHKKEKKWFSLTITPFVDLEKGVILTIENITATLKNSHALREAEQLYRQQFNQSLAGTIIGTPEGEIIDANPSACNILGYSRDELIRGGRSLIMDMNHPKNKRAFDNREEESRYVGEKVYIHKSGREIPVESSSVLYRDHNGKVISINNFKDLTGRKKAEEESRRERNFRKAAESSIPGTFFILDKKGKMMEWNNAFRDELGYDLHEIPGMNAVDFIADHDKKRVMETIQKIFTEGEGEIVAQVKTKHDGLRFQRLRGKKFTTENGEYLVGTGLDITELVYAEAEKNEALEKMNQLFENSPIGIVMVNEVDKIVSSNPSFKKMFGYTDDRIEGKKLDNLITPDFKLDESLLNSDKAFQGISLQMESVRKRKDGSEIPVMISSVPIVIDDAVIAIYGMYVDLSEQKEMETQIQELLESEK
ncbi:MAG: PAS domain S-box protein, partial [Balneolaceae bacterium]